MKRQIIYLSVVVAMLLISCYKDKGNYHYSMPEEPVVHTLDSVYAVFVGDSLIIDPGVTSSKGSGQLQLFWKISVPERLASDTFSGPQLRIIFGLGPKRYHGRLTITDMTNGMKYFRDFSIDGKTAFSKGMVVLSDEGGAGKLTFIKPDGSVQAHLYEAIHNEPLPGKPHQIIAVAQSYNPTVINSYWMFFGEGAHAGLQLDANTMQRMRYLNENFFAPPATIKVGLVQPTFQGVITGVLNGRLYAGTTSTWDQSPLYGMFGLSSPGDYNLADQFIFNFNPSIGAGYYIGFDKNRKQFLRFNLYGTPNYFGDAYDVIGDAFDPKNMEMDLLYLQQINGNDVYAFMKGADGIVYECMFGVEFNGPFQITPIHKRAFVRQGLFTGNEKLAVSQTGIFYITSANKIYRYNPLNQEVRELTFNPGDKDISMVKIIDDNTLVTGSDGALYFLDISTGHYGDLISKIERLPGNPVDIAVRN